jgi:membrane protein implicated in regulation of membrane protease activity
VLGISTQWWQPLSSIGALVVAAITGWWAFRRGSKNDENLNLTHRIEVNVDIQQKIIDNLQQEVGRNRSGWEACLRQCGELQAKVEVMLEENQKLRVDLDHAHTEIILLKQKVGD